MSDLGSRQAFPHEERTSERVRVDKDGRYHFRNETVNVPRPGMTILEHYAGIALGALLAAPGREGSEARRNPDAAAEWAREHAEALIQRLERPRDPVEALRFDLERLADAGIIGRGHIDELIEGILEGDRVPRPNGEPS